MAIHAQSSCTLSTITDVEAVYTYYHLASSTITIDEAPKDGVNPPGASEIIVISGGDNYKWQLTEPNLSTIQNIAVGQLYIIECVLFSDGTYDWGPLMASSTYAAAKAAYNLSSQAFSQAQAANNATALLGGHFIYNSTWDTTDTPHSANVVQTVLKNGVDVTEQPGQWDYNVHIGANGIKLRNNENTLSEWTSSNLVFYRPGTTTADAILNTNGLTLFKGGIESGNLTSGNGYVYLSTEDKTGITINEHTPNINNNNDPKWRAIIGSKFGVTSDGTLYASNANVTGAITATSLKIGNDTAAITNLSQIDNTAIKIGGRNLLLKTAEFEEKTHGPVITAGGYSVWDAYDMVVPYNQLGLEAGDTITISFNWRATDVPNGTVTMKVGAVGDPWEYFGTIHTFTAGSSVGSVSKTFTVPSGSALISNTGSKLRFRFDSSVAIADGVMTFAITSAKLEIGNTRTQWTPAPEDAENALANLQIGGRNLLRNTKDYYQSIRSANTDIYYNWEAEGASQILCFDSYTGDLAWKYCRFKPFIPYSLVRGKQVTISFKYRSSAWTLTTGGVNRPVFTFELFANPSDETDNDRVKYKIINDANISAPDITWQDYKQTFIINDALFTTGSGTISTDLWFTVGIWQYNNAPLEYKEVKLEFGGSSTDWTRAPEDIDETGENLLRDSNAKSIVQQTASANRYFSDTSNTNVTCTYEALSNQEQPAPIEGIKYGAKFVVAANSSSNGRCLAFYSNGIGTPKLIENRVYTMSCWVRGTGQIRFQIGNGSPYYTNNNTNSTMYSNKTYNIASSSWTQVYWSFLYKDKWSGNMPILYYGIVGNNTTSSIQTVYMCGFKLEEGNIPTQWNTGMLDAAGTASSFITRVDAENGIRVHDAENVDTNYIQVNANGISIIKSSQERLKIAANAVRVGTELATEYNVYVTNEAVQIRKGTTVLAEYGSSIILNKPNGNSNTYINADGIHIPEGVIGGWNINVSHIYKYTTAATTVYDNSKTEEQNLTSGAIQYGAFMQAVNGTPTPDQGAFYVGYRKCTAISNNTPTYSSWSYPFVVHYNGTITATRGQIAGWTINTSGFYKKTDGDNNGSKFAALYASNIGSTTNHVLTFAERSSGAWDYKTYVRGDGYLYSKYGQIGTWKVSPTGATTTHCYNGNLYGQATDGTYDYEVGMKADGNPTNTNVDSSSYLAFYISKVAHGADWNSTNRTNVFYINQGGKLYASNAEIEGKITATSGSIAGWTITGSCIEKDNTGDTNGTRCGIQNSNTYSPTRAVFYAGTKTAAGGYIANETDSNFYVRQDGYMYCAEAKVAGTIIANAGTIGGWNIGTDSNKSLYYDNQVPGATTSNLVLSPTSATNTNAIAGSGTGKTWFISAGQKFGVDTSGTLYASGATINGNTTITGNTTIDSSVTIGGKNQSEYLNDNINVGGRNLLRGTASVVIGSGQTEGSWTNAKFYKSDSTDGTVESVSYSNPLNLATVIKATAGSTTNANIGIAQSAVPIAKTTVTLSAWVKGTAGDTVRLQPCYVESDGGKPESGYKDFTIADGNWHRYEYTKTLAYDHLDGSVRAGFVYGRTATAGRVFYICGVKLEYGNKATDWNQAPEDESGVNLVPWPYYRYAISGSPYTSQGITWTLNADGSVTAKGTASAENNSWYHCVDNRDAKNPNGMYCLPAGTYTLSGCPAGGSSTTYRNQINFYSDTLNPSTEATDTDGNSYRYDLGKGVTFTLASKTYIRIHPVIYKGVTCPNVGYTFYPMLENGGVVHKFVSPKLNEGAASTASKYITRITDEGIYISPADQLPTANAPGNSIKIDGSGMEVFRNNSSVAFYGEFTRIGEGDKYQALISENGIEFSDSDGANKFSVVPSGQYYSQQKKYSATILPTGTISFRANIEAHAITFSLYNPTSTGEGNIQSVTVDSSQMAIGSTVTVGNATYQCKIRRRDINTFFAQQTGNTRTILRLDLSWTSGYNIEMTKISFTGINPILVNDVVQLMQASQTVYLSEPISNQLTGIVLAWSAFENGEAKDEDWNYTFIPKNHVRLFNSKRVSTGLLTSENSAEFIGIKYVEVYDNCIKGYAGNESSSTSQGITYTNNHWVLRYVYGV